MMNGLWLSLSIGTAVVCAPLAINAKQFCKYSGPAIQIPRRASRALAQDRQLFYARVFNRSGQRCCRVFPRPRFLVMADNPIHVASADSHYRRATRLTFQRDKPKRFLHARVNEEIGCPIITREIGRVGAILNP